MSDLNPKNLPPEVVAGADRLMHCLAWGLNITDPMARMMVSAPTMLNALRRAALALAFAAESSPAMQDDYNAVSEAIAKATGAKP
jgi:hypothetical protein